MKDMLDPKGLIFTREAVRAIDREAIDQYGIPGIVLMENAAVGLVACTLELINRMDLKRSARILIVCGGGNNGGDGLAAARHLENHGHVVTVILTEARDRYRGDAAINLKVIEQMNLNVVDASTCDGEILRQFQGMDVVMDALFGTGLNREIKGAYVSWVNEINALQAPVIAVDIPSGMDCDTGLALGAMVQAEMTVTFVGRKQGFENGESSDALGTVRIVDIGAPRELVKKYGHGSEG